MCVCVCVCGIMAYGRVQNNMKWEESVDETPPKTDHVNHGVLQGLGTVCTEEGMFPQVKLQEATDVVGVRLVHDGFPGRVGGRGGRKEVH